jgi:hypothetical protein
MGKGPEYYRRFAPVKQDDETECWAASLDWWSYYTQSPAILVGSAK